MNLSALLAVCRVTGDERDYLLHLSEPQTTLGWQIDHRILADNQQQAASVTAFHGSLVPSLCQVAGYATAVISPTLNVPFGEVVERVADRMASQQIFDRDKPPNCTFFIRMRGIRCRSADRRSKRQRRWDSPAATMPAARRGVSRPAPSPSSTNASNAR
jgi:hypothetical protein